MGELPWWHQAPWRWNWRREWGGSEPTECEYLQQNSRTVQEVSDMIITHSCSCGLVPTHIEFHQLHSTLFSNWFYFKLCNGTECLPSGRENTYRVFQEERSIFWEVTVSVILSKKLYTNMCPIPNGFRDRTIWMQTANLLIRKRYYECVLFLIPVFIVQVTELVQFIINVRKFHRLFRIYVYQIVQN